MQLLPTTLAVLPLFCFVIWTAGTFICYAIGLSKDHYPPLPHWPYVSDVGANPPESCIFTIVNIWVGIGLSFSVIVYYKYMQTVGAHGRINVVTLIFGQIGFVGCTFVASFQWTELLYPHMLGAIMVFAGLAIYSWLVAAMTWKDKQSLYPKIFIAFRLILAVAITMACLMFAIFLFIKGDSEVLFLVTTGSEWASIFLELVMISTLAFEARDVTGITFTITASPKEIPRGDPEENETTKF